MKKEKLVSINIPTHNSEKTLNKTLESIKNQTYKKIETIIIDSYSKDKTIWIAKKYKCRVFRYKGKLLGARYEGAKNSRGEIILLLDSDQILEKTAIERAVNLLRTYDILWLEEFTYKPKTFLEKLFDADRKLVQKYYENFVKVKGGVILPRIYKKEILIRAMENIPKEVLPICAAHDHAIIYYEVSKISENIGKLPNAVWHIEPSNLIWFWKKTYRWGKTTRDLIDRGIYVDLIKSKLKFRKFYFKDFSLSIKSLILRVLRGVPYLMGYSLRKNDEK